MTNTQSNSSPASKKKGVSKNARVPSRKHATLATVSKACRSLMEEMDDVEVEQLWRNGSIWIWTRDWETNQVSSGSFIFLGSIHDGITYQHADGFSLLVDFEGMAEAGVLETELNPDDDEDEIEVDDSGTSTVRGGFELVTIQDARESLIAVAEGEIEARFEEIEIRFRG